MASEYTENYNLDLYVDTDKPNLRDQYNSAVRKIDQQMKTNAVNVTTAQNTANDAHDIAKQAQADIATEKTERTEAIAAETTAREQAIAAETAAREQAITAETTARNQAIAAEKTAREQAIAAETAARTEAVTKLTEMDGLSNAKVEIFTDDTAWPADGDVDVWTYFKSIFNKDSLDFNVNQATVNTGWVKTNSAGQNANAYMTQIAESQSQDYRNAVQYVILNFGFYDIFNSESGDYEAAGRTIVNRASDMYPNAIIVVNPVSNRPCFGYDRKGQMNMYGFNYGAVRSQVPLRIVPWYLAWNINQGAKNHYYDTQNSNPYKLNGGGTNSIAANIKEAMTGCECAYMRASRSNLSNYVTDNFKADHAEFYLDVPSQKMHLSCGILTAKNDITENVKVGNVTDTMLSVSDDTIIAIGIQNTSKSPVKGFLVLTAHEELYFRLNENATINSGSILRLVPSGGWNPEFQNM